MALKPSPGENNCDSLHPVGITRQSQDLETLLETLEIILRCDNTDLLDTETLYEITEILLRNHNVNLFDEAGNSALYFASLNGRDNVVEYLLETILRRSNTDLLDIEALFEITEKLLSSHNINLLDEDGHSALHFASLTGRDNVVENLLRDPLCDINLFSQNNDTALHLAAVAGNREIVKQLIGDPRCDINLFDGDMDSALHKGITNEHTEIAQQLIRHPDCNVNLLNGEGNNALHLACYVTNKTIIEQLLMDERCDVALVGCTGDTGLMTTACAAHVWEQTFKGKIDKIFDTEAGDKTYKDKIEELLIKRLKGVQKSKLSTVLNNQNELGNTLFHAANKYGLYKLADLLISEPKCDISVKNFDGQTALDSLITSMVTHDGSVIAVAINLIDKVLMRETEMPCSEKQNILTQIAFASYRLNETEKESLQNVIIKKILTVKPIENILNQQNEMGDTLLHIASKCAFYKLLDFLLNETKCDTKILNNAGQTFLGTLIGRMYRRKHSEVIKVLEKLLHAELSENEATSRERHYELMQICSLGEKVDERNKGEFDLMLTKAIKKAQSMNPSENIVTLQNDHGDTILHMACKSALYCVLDSILSDFDCNISLKNVKGETVFDCLVEKMVTGNTEEFRNVFYQLKLQNGTLLFRSDVFAALLLFVRKVNDGHEFHTSEESKKRLKHLLTYGESVNLRKDTFARSINRNSFEICNTLLGRNAILNSAIHGSETALHCAIRLNSKRKVKRLMDRRPNLSIAWRGLTPLQFAIVNGASGHILELLSENMTIDEIEENVVKCCALGETPLTCSARLGVQKWIEGFCERYNCFEKDGTGLSAHDILCKSMVSKRLEKLQTNQSTVMKDWYKLQKSTSVKLTPGELRAYGGKNVVKTVRNCRAYFIRHADEVNEAKEQTVEVLKTVSEELSNTEASAFLEFDIELAGSMAEETKCYYPDEIDLLCVFKHTNDLEFRNTQGDYFRIKAKPGTEWADLCTDGLLEQGKVSSALYKETERILAKLVASKTTFGKLHLFQYSFLLRDKISGLQLLFRGDVFRDMMIYVDLVATFELPQGTAYEPLETLPLGTKCKTYYLIAKKSRQDDDVPDYEFRVTMSVGERAVLDSLPSNIRDGFIFAKAVRLANICGRKQYSFYSPFKWFTEPIRTEDFITSYILKNVLFAILRETEDVENDKDSPYQWVLAIYKCLQYFLELRAIPAWNYKTTGYLLYCKECKISEEADLQACCQKSQLMLELTKRIIWWLEENGDYLEDVEFSKQGKHWLSALLKKI